MYQFRFAPVFARVDLLWQGAVATLWISAAVIAAGSLVGVAGAVGSRSGVRAVRAAVRGYVEAVRNTPLLAQLFFIYFGLPGVGLRLEAVPAALIALTVNLGAYTTEIVRGGIAAVPQGYKDAGAALGLKRWQVFLLVVLKPALKVMFPALASQFTLLMLATSILSQIGVPDLFHMGSLIDSDTYRSFEVYAVVCGFYLGLAILFRGFFAAVYWVVFAEREPAAPVEPVMTP